MVSIDPKLGTYKTLVPTTPSLQLIKSFPQPKISNKRIPISVVYFVQSHILCIDGIAIHYTVVTRDMQFTRSTERFQSPARPAQVSGRFLINPVAD